MVYKVHKSIFRRNISSLIVAAILLFLIFFYFGIDKILDQISKVPDWTIASVLLLYFLIYALLILKWKFIIDCVKKVNYFALIPIYLAGGMFNQLTPGTTSGGQPYRAYHLRKLNHQDLATNLSTTIFDSLPKE